MDKVINFHSLSNFYKNKDILITGHTGFKGTWLVKILQTLGARIYGFSLPKTKQNSFYSLHDFNLIGDFEGNINNENDLFNLRNKINPEIVIHLAAQPLVIESYKNPLLTHQTNIMGTANVLNLLSYFSNLRVSLFITTDKVYKNDNLNFNFKESDPLGGYDPYSASKAASEIIIESWRSTLNPRKIKILSARAGNVIGGGDWSENRLIPDIFRAINKNQKVEIRNPKSTRPWQHVIEPLIGYLTFIKSSYDNNNHVYSLNFGPNLNDIKPVETVVMEISKILNKNFADFVTIQADHQFYESKLLSLDNTLAKNTIGWVPKFTFSDGLKMTSDWYTQYKILGSNSILESQIEHYFRVS